MSYINNFKNTIIGIIMVFIFLFTFCLVDYTILWITKNEVYATIAGLISIVILIVTFTTDLWSSPSRGERINDLEPKGIDITKSVYPEIETTDQIKYPENHAEQINPIHNIEKDEKSE